MKANAKQRAEASDIMLLSDNQSEALTHPALAQARTKAGTRAGQGGDHDRLARSRQPSLRTSRTKRSSDVLVQRHHGDA